jgi:uncharacterized membrane protein
MEYRSGAVSPVGSISTGFAIIKDDYWVFFGMVVLAGLITIVAGGIFGGINNVITFFAGTVMSGPGSSQGASLAKTLIPQIISMIISFFSNIVVVTISGVLMCGIYAAIAKKASTGIADFGVLFSAFDKLTACLIVSVVLAILQFILGVIGVGVGVGLGVGAISVSGISEGGFNPAVLGGVFLVIIGVIVIVAIVNFIISMLTTFAYPLVADRSMSGIDALLLSARATFSNFGGILGLWLLLVAMAIAGVLVCFVGVLFVAPLIVAAIFAAYQSVFGTSASPQQQTPPPPPVWGVPPGHQPGY